MNLFPPHLSDFYKVSHPEQYPIDTESILGNYTPRSSRMDGVEHVVFFGLQYFIIEYLQRQFNENFFWLSKTEFDKKLKNFKRRIDNALQSDNDVSRWEDLYLLRYLPLEIRSLSEGSLVPLKVPFFTIKPTNKRFFWLGQWMETLLSNVIWHPITTATIAYQYRKLLNAYASETSDMDDFVQYQGHDFSMRGHSSPDSSFAGGAGHLLSFAGTDTIGSIDFLESYYGADSDNEVVGTSCAATEHSVMTVNGEEGEFDVIKRLITEVHPKGIVSIVSDTYNLFRVLTDYLPRLKDEILSRDGKVVIRPDCYDDQTEIFTDSGWKYFSDLKIEDKVAQVNEFNEYEFVYPKEIVKQEYKGNMYCFFNQKGNVDLVVTPNHRMVVTDRNGIERIIEAEKLSCLNYNMVTCKGKSGKGFVSFGDFDRLLISIQADGSLVKQNRGGAAYFSFTKGRKINRLKEILERLGYIYNSEKTSRGDTGFYITSVGNNVTFHKRFAEWIDLEKIDKQWAREFIDEIGNWDGQHPTDNLISFFNNNKSDIDIVKQLCLVAGYTYIEGKQRDTYRLYIRKNNNLSRGSYYSNIQRYDGYVYCVKVPSGKVLVRRNKCIIVSGNSGDPVKIICGHTDPFTTLDSWTPADKGVIRLLDEVFGSTFNSKGYKQLNLKVGAIYGDSITLDRCKAICDKLKENGYASTNIVFGIGSYTYQMISRDTFGQAFKATAIKRAGVWSPMFKNPITDNGMKRSARGLLAVIPDIYTGELTLHENVTEELERSSWNVLRTVFLNGVLTSEITLSDIRKRLYG